MSDQHLLNYQRASRNQLGLTSIKVDDKEQLKAETASYLAEMKVREDLSSLTAEQVEEIDLLFGGNGYHKKIYGNQTAIDSIKKYSCKIARKTYHQAIAGPLAKIYAQEAIKLARKVSNNGDNLNIAELYTGSGSLTYALLKESGRVQHTVDINCTILEWARGNLEKIGCDVGSTNWVNQDALEFISTAANEGWRFNLVVADPPWEGKFSKNDAFSIMSPHGARVVKKIFQLTKIIGLKAPGTIPDQAAFSLADELRAKVSSLTCCYEDGQKKYSEKFFFFITPEAAKHANIKRHQITEQLITVGR